MDEEKLAIGVSAYKEVFEATGDLDITLSHLRELGYGQIPSILVISEVHNLPLKYAKIIFTWSKAWKDQDEVKNRLDDVVEKAFDELNE